MDFTRNLLQRYGILEADVAPLEEASETSLDIRYRVNGEEQRAILRLYFDWVDRRDIEAEVVWLNELTGATNLLLPAPIAAQDGSFIQEITPESGTEACFAVLRRWLPGDLLAEEVSPRRFRQVGSALAALHNHSASVADSHVTRREAFQVWVDDWSGAREIATDAEVVLQTAAGQVSAALEALSKRQDRYGFIHADPHPWNILVSGDSVAIFDFSDCGWGPHAYDIATTLVYCRFPWVWDDGAPETDYPDLEAALLEGYASERAVPGNLEEALPICFAARLLVFVQWVVEDLGSIDATSYSRQAVTNSIDFLRQNWMGELQ